MPVSTAVLGAVRAARVAHTIGRRANSALNGGAAGAAGAVAPSLVPAIQGGSALAVASSVAVSTRRAERVAAQASGQGQNRLFNKMVKFILGLGVLLYFLDCVTLSAPNLPVLPGQWFSPTYGQLFNAGSAPGYLSPGDVWNRIKPTGTAPPEGWSPSDEELRAAVATYSWDNVCDTTPATDPGATVTPAGGVVEDWLKETAEGYALALRETFFNAEHAYDFAERYFNGWKRAITFAARVFTDVNDLPYDQQYDRVLASYQEDLKAQCSCPVTVAPASSPSSAASSLYSNGNLPSVALMPLQTASGQELRPDAAAAFDAMSRAYAADMGAPISVTDSYRSYADQVAVKAAKGWLAATPGTSNHGWGIAVDLGGGINRFGTAQRAWMEKNAAAYGWFSPSWAQATGSKPEAWHWEFNSDAAPAPTLAATSCTPALIGA